MVRQSWADETCCEESQIGLFIILSAVKGPQVDFLISKYKSDSRVAQGAHLLDSLGAIHGVDVLVQARMATEFGDGVAERFQECGQSVDTDTVWVRLALARLPIELTAVTY